MIRPATGRDAFTIMELITVIVIISILTLLVISSVAGIREKAARGRCVNNLHALYAAGAAYLTDHESWPQIPATDVESREFARAWIDAFKPYQIGAVIWKCETVQKGVGGTMNEDPEDPVIDYLPTSFDSKPSSPWLYTTHPWFVERADAHGGGNLFILANGQIHAVSDYRKP